MSERPNHSSEILISDAVASCDNALHERTNQTGMVGILLGSLQRRFLQVTNKLKKGFNDMTNFPLLYISIVCVNELSVI